LRFNAGTFYFIFNFSNNNYYTLSEYIKLNYFSIII